MNRVDLFGRLTRDPELRYTPSQVAVARFSVAIDRGKDRNGQSKGTDFPSIVVFGRTAEACSQYLAKGRQVVIEGHIQTGSYERSDGTKVYTTEVVADKVEFAGGRSDSSGQVSQPERYYSNSPAPRAGLPEDQGIPEGFHEYDENDDEMPF